MLWLVAPEKANPPGEYSAPLVLGDALIAGASSHQVAALTWKDMETIWTHPTKGRVLSSPAYGDGKIFIADDEGEVAALDLEGRQIWSFKAEYPVLAAPVFDEGRLYVLQADENLFCLRASDGTPLWQYGRTVIRQGGIWRGTSLAVGGGQVYLGHGDGSVIAFGAEAGGVAWKAKISTSPLFPDVIAGPVFDSGIVYAGTREGPLTALDARTGNILWTKPYGLVGGIAVGEDRLYFGTPDGGLRAVRKSDGESLWTAMLDGGLATPPVEADGEVVVGASGGSIFALDAASGEVRKRYNPATGIGARPWVGANGLVFLSNAGVLHRIDRR
jgi:outer membrane protein assembly factor BamB